MSHLPRKHRQKRYEVNTEAILAALAADERDCGWLGRKLGVHATTALRMVKNHPWYRPTWERVERMADVLGVAPETLILSTSDGNASGLSEAANGCHPPVIAANRPANVDVA